VNLTDELLRSALRETGYEIPAGRVGALDLSAAGSGSRASARLLGPRRRWLTAATAAVAVAAVIAGSVVLASALPGRPSRPASAPPSAPVPGTIPRYYAVLTNVHGDGPIGLVLHNARTGAILATAVPPQHFSYTEVTAAADDMTFVVGAQTPTSGQQGSQPTSMVFFLARFNPASSRITLHQLAIPALPTPDGIALSPDGAKLAVALSAGPRLTGGVRLYSLATGVVKTWTTPGEVDESSGEQGLAWAPDGDLAFLWFGPSNGPAKSAPDGIWRLNPNAPAGNLLAASTLLVRQDQPSGYGLQGPFALVDNGAEVISVVERAHSAAWAVVSEYDVFSARTGRVIRSFLPTSQYVEALWWANAAGTLLVGTIPQEQGKSVVSSPLEWVSGSRHAPVKGASSFWLDLAF
jgi:DNA-binding beta-propeller fold protein YncE